MILHTQPAKPWTKHDFLLLEAHQILESERCGQCGYPIYICHNEDERIQFRLDEDTCSIRAAVERQEEAESKKKNAKTKHGTQIAPTPYVMKTPGDEGETPTLSDFREPYYKAQMEKRAKLERS